MSGLNFFVDLDEVLADWLSPMLCLLDYEPDVVYAAWAKRDPRPWNVFEVISTSPRAGWRHIEIAGDSFWRNLPRLPHARTLMRLCQGIGETTVLTSPSKHHTSYSGKQKWLDHHFGKGFAHKHALIGGCKHVVARPGAVLIDDSPSHCEKWRAEGGHAILFPGYGNELYKHRGRALDYIMPQLQELSEQAKK